MFEWGLSLHRVNLHINELPNKLGTHIVLDIEDNEQDVFVGLGILSLDNPDIVWYFSDFELVKQIDWSEKRISGHNVKYDFHQLKRWGISINPNQLEDDTERTQRLS
jgi:hypothetical protein